MWCVALSNCGLAVCACLIMCSTSGLLCQLSFNYLLVSRHEIKMKFFFALLFVALTGCSIQADTRLAEQAVLTFHEMLDAKQFQAIYDQSGQDFKEVATRQDFIALVDAIHRKLGATKSVSLQSKSIENSISGTLVTLDYATIYAEGEAAEQFQYQIQGEHALLLAYHISSNTLITK
jgi:hypothetical protein